MELLGYLGRAAVDAEIHLALRGRGAKIFELSVQRTESGPCFFFGSVSAERSTQYTLDQLPTALELVGIHSEHLRDELRRVVVEQALVHEALLLEAQRLLDAEGRRRLADSADFCAQTPQLCEWLPGTISAG